MANPHSFTIAHNKTKLDQTLNNSPKLLQSHGASQDRSHMLLFQFGHNACHVWRNLTFISDAASDMI